MIEILLFGGILLGAFLFCERWLNELTGGIAEVWQEKFFLHIKTLLRITTGKGNEARCRVFLSVSAVTGALPILFLYGKVAQGLVLVTGLFLCLLPYILLRLKLQVIRVESSREGEILVTELLENYKIHYFNMQRAIEVSAAGMEEAPNCRRLLFNLSKGLNAAGSAAEIKRLLEEFRLSINTSWANILAVNLYFALSGGMQVTYALSDLAAAVAMARKVDEYVKRENNEAKLMLKYLAPIAYLLTLVGGIAFFRLTWKKYLFYQFHTTVGLTWLMISLLLYAVGILLYVYISRGKLDL